jgi:UDP-glucose 4-epimerase
MKCIVTGVAGFIGSHLAERLIKLGYDVLGIDCFTDYYPRELKERNLQQLIAVGGKKFTMLEEDLVVSDLTHIVTDEDYIFHEAAQPGVRASWGVQFDLYIRNNVLATQKLLEAVKHVNINRFIYASSSSVYGNCAMLPMREDITPEPISPYGVTKLACEHLCKLYYEQFDVPIMILRYFTVYGPRQRPDMGFYKFIYAALTDTKITIYGDGSQIRDFTYISDVIDANILAMTKGNLGEVYNIGGGTKFTINAALELVEKLTGKQLTIDYTAVAKGDVRATEAAITKAESLLGYAPKVKLATGLRAEIEWLAEQIKP